MDWGGREALVADDTLANLPVLSDDELIALYSRTRINLGFSTCGNTHQDGPGARIVQIRLRDFEIPMAGGFYMVEHLDELAP